MASVPYTIKLSNGVIQPLIGIGTWQSKDKKEVFDALKAAFDVGYRYIDTAGLYNNEEIIGEFLETYFKDAKLKREDIFLVTKLPFQMHKPEDAAESIEKQLRALRTHYIDLYIIHNACSVKKGPDGGFLKNENGQEDVFDYTPHIETWKVLENYYKDQKFRAIGVSNFRSDQLQNMYDAAEIKPHNLQIELHIYHRQRKLVDLCRKLEISITSYGTLGSPGRKAGFGPGDYPDADCLGNPLVEELAKKYAKTPAQILLRHMIQQKISIIPKSLNPNRVKENFDIFDFEISAKDMERFDSEVTEDVRLFSFSFAKGHPQYPPFEV